jgi:hypothetical protein
MVRFRSSMGSDRRNALWSCWSLNIQLDLGGVGLRVVHESVQVRPRALGFSHVQPLSNLLDRKRRLPAQSGCQSELYRMAFLLGGQIVLRPLQARQFLRQDSRGVGLAFRGASQGRLHFVTDRHALEPSVFASPETQRL